MLLSLADAAGRLQRSIRQVRYQVKKGELPARKVGGVWMIEEGDLVATPAQARHAAEKDAALRQAVEEALPPASDKEGPYTVTTIRAFNELLLVTRQAGVVLSPDHRATGALTRCTIAISRGAHAFRSRAKGEAYEAAREAAAEAVALLHLDGGAAAREIADRVEAKVLPAIGGLVRRSESRAPR